MTRRRSVIALGVSILVVATSCSSDDGAKPRPSGSASGASSTTASSDTTATTAPGATTETSAAAAATTVAPPPAPTVPTVPRSTPQVTGPAQITPSPAQPAAASCPPVPARPAPRTDRPTYKLALDVRLDEGAVIGSQTVRFTPDIDTDRMVFRLWANAPRTAKSGGGIEVGLDGAKQTDPTTLVLMRPIRAGETVEVDLTWRLRLPTSANSDRISRIGDVVRLGSFFPILAWHPGVGWATEPATSAFAEASLSLPADFDVTMTVPPGLGVLATGVSDKPGHWVASGVGDWAASIGDFKIVTGRAEGDIDVTVGVDRRVGDAPGPYLDKVIAALNDFNRRFGPYPWPSYSLALTPELSGGIEYPMHVMQGPGTLGRTTSHEVAHMWFYGLVASNQGASPWIDEGLSTFAEARYENTLAELKAKTIPAEGKGRAGEPMSFWETRQSIYYRSVYSQGGQAVAALGSGDLADCALRQLVARQAYRVTSTRDVIDAFATVTPDAAAILDRFGIRP